MIGNPLRGIREIVDHAKRVGRLQVELKTIELKGKAVRVGIGGAFGLLALLLSPLLIVFALATVAAALATAVHVWLAILIVTFILLALVGGLAGAAAVLIAGARDGRR